MGEEMYAAKSAKQRAMSTQAGTAYAQSVPESAGSEVLTVALAQNEELTGNSQIIAGRIIDYLRGTPSDGVNGSGAVPGILPTANRNLSNSRYLFHQLEEIAVLLGVPL